MPSKQVPPSGDDEDAQVFKPTLPSQDEEEMLARTFASEGLIAAGVTDARIQAAALSGEPLSWRLPSPDELSEAARAGDRLERARAAVAAAGQEKGKHSEFSGLRLIASLPDSASAVAGMMAAPGYLAAGHLPSGQTGMASLAFEKPQADVGIGPAFSWPLEIVGASADLASALKGSEAVRSGLAVLRPERGRPGARQADIAAGRQSQGVDATLLDLPEAYGGRSLVLGFRGGGAGARDWPAVPSDEAELGAFLRRAEPLALLPLEEGKPAELLTRFVEALSHNLPVDVAAWEATRQQPGRLAPLVVAPKGFLERARLSAIIPELVSRLSALPRGWILPVEPSDLVRISPLFRSLETRAQFTVGQVLTWLERPESFAWGGVEGAATGLIALNQGVALLEQQETDRGGAHRSITYSRDVPLALPPDYEESAEFQISPDVLFSEQEEAPVEEILGTDPSRFTDITLLDGARPLSTLEPLVHGRAYTLDVAVRVQRRGLTKDRGDQPPVHIPGQTETETVWVILSDESLAEDDDAEGGAFEIAPRFRSFRLPVRGDSENSAAFTLTPTVKPFRRRGGGRGRLGIRLYHKLNLIDHLELDARLEVQPDTPLSPPKEPAIKVAFCRPDAAGVERLDPARAERRLNISIGRVAGTESTYRFAVAFAGTAGEPEIYATKRLPAGALDSFVTRFRNILIETVFGEAFDKTKLSQMVRDETLERLRRLGLDLMTSLFDYGPGGDFFNLGMIIGEALPQVPIVQIALDESAGSLVLPWQILSVDVHSPLEGGPQLKPEDNLWGFRFIIEVKRCGDGVDVRPEDEKERRPVLVRYGHWAFSAEAEHHKRLAKMIAAHAGQAVLQEPVIGSAKELLAALRSGGGHLLYIFAHGCAAAPATPSGVAMNAKFLEKLAEMRPGLEGDEFAPQREVLEALQKVLESGDTASALFLGLSTVRLPDLLLAMPPDGAKLTDAPILFLNTCESAQLWNSIENSFASFFLARGARAVIGSEATIPTVFADRFGCEVMGHILDGETVGEAVRQARLSLLQTERNPLGLCYAIYGAADARLLSPHVAGGVGT